MGLWTAAALLLSTAFLLPNHYLPWTSFHSEAAAFAAVAVAALTIHFRTDRSRSGAGTWISLVIVAVIVWQLAAGQVAYFGDGAVSVLYVLGFALAWGVGSLAVPRDHKRLLAGLAATLVTAATVSVLLAAWQWLGLDSRLGYLGVDRPPGSRPFANLGQPNHLGTLFAMAGVLSLELFRSSWLKRWQLLVLLVWLTFGLALTASRAAFLGAIVASLFILWRGPRNGVPVSLRAMVAWWVVLAVFWFGLGPLGEALHLSALRTDGFTNPGTRWVMWQQFAAAIAASPWVGYGWRQSIVAHKVGAPSAPSFETTEYAHNIVLDLLVWMGLPLGLLVLAGVAWWSLRVLRRISDRQQFVCVAALLPLLVHSMLEFPFAYSYFLFPAGVLLGIVASRQAPAPAPQSGRLGRAAAWGVLASFTVLAGWVASDYMKVEEDHRVLRFQVRGIGERPSGHPELDVKVLTQFREMHSLLRMPLHDRWTAVDIERLRVGSRVFPSGSLMLKYAAVLAIHGSPEEGLRELQLIRAVYGEAAYVDSLEQIRMASAQWPQLQRIRLPG